MTIVGAVLWAGFRPLKGWVVFTGVFAWLALGPFITVAQQLTYVPTPWALLRYLPIIGAARMPTRLTILVMLGVSMLLAMAVQHLRSRSRHPRLLAGCDRRAAARSSCCRRRGRCTRPRSRRSIEMVAADPRPIRVLSLPFGLRDGLSSRGNYSSSSQFYQTFHEKRLVGGYISRLPGESIERYRRNPTMRVLLRLSEGTPVEPELYDDALRRTPIATCSRLQIGYVVDRPEPRARPELVAFAHRAFEFDARHEARAAWSSIARRWRRRTQPCSSERVRLTPSDRVPRRSATASARAGSCPELSSYNARVHGDLAARPKPSAGITRIDLGGGVVTKGIDDTPAASGAARSARSRSPGMTVLDIGAWDGFFSFEAERRGAARVVAADYFSWHGAGWGSKAGFELARRALGSKVEDVDIDVMDLSPERVGQFDVVFFLGVLYHLRHPLLALERIASVTRQLLILETVVDMVGISRPAMAFYPGRELNNDPTNWWAPNVPGCTPCCSDVGFDDVRTVTLSRRRSFARRAPSSHRLTRPQHAHASLPPGSRRRPRHPTATRVSRDDVASHTFVPVIRPIPQYTFTADR